MEEFALRTPLVHLIIMLNHRSVWKFNVLPTQNVSKVNVQKVSVVIGLMVSLKMKAMEYQLGSISS